MERDFLGSKWKGSSKSTAKSDSDVGDSKTEHQCQKEFPSVRDEDQIIQKQNVSQPHILQLPSPTLFYPPSSFISKNSQEMMLNSFPPSMDNASSSLRENKTMTIFYGNDVYIYHDVSPQAAQEIAATALSSDCVRITTEKVSPETINVDEICMRNQTHALQDNAALQARKSSLDRFIKERTEQ